MRPLGSLILNKKELVKKEFQEWLITTHNVNEVYSMIYQSPRPRIECEDGFSFSVQGGRGVYSTPREFGTQFTHMEIGFPSEYEDLIQEYSEGGDYIHSVYPYVPVEIIINVIKKHGGMKKN